MYADVVLKCNKAGCKNEVVAGTRGEASKKAADKGWTLKSASTHFCPTHSEKKVVKAKAGKPDKKAGKAGKAGNKVGKANPRGNVLSFNLNDTKPN